MILEDVEANTVQREGAEPINFFVTPGSAPKNVIL